MSFYEKQQNKHKDAVGCFADWIINSSEKKLLDNKYRLCYEKNKKALIDYRYKRNIQLPEYDGLPISIIYTEKSNYVYFNKNKNSIHEEEIKRTDIVQNPFFSDLGKPLLIKNEMNTYHFEYLCDNVRDSKYYGDDNHIYVYYDSMDKFLLLLQVEDITPYLSKEKIIFIFGEDDLNKNYPLDFSIYGINYDKMQRKPIQVDEVCRLFVNLHWRPDVGNDFTYGIFDYHKNLLTMGQRGLPDYTVLYKLYLFNKTIDEFEYDYLNENMDPLIYKAFSIMFGKIAPAYTEITERPDPDPRIFFSFMRELWEKEDIPDQLEWIKLLYLAYSRALNRNFESRIVPAIMLNTHWNVKFPGEDPWKYNYDFFYRFKYCRMFIPFRRPIVSFGAMNLAFTKIQRDRNYIAAINWYLLGHFTLIGFKKKDDPILKLAKMIRFEDLKLHTNAMLRSICEYLDIEWDDIMLQVTYNGKDVYFDGTGGYDPTPVYRRYFQFCNPFDYYRFEVVLSKYWKHWGYQPLFYQEEITYSKKDIRKMFEIPFQCERYHLTDKAKLETESARKRMYQLLEERMSEGDTPLDKDGEEMLPIPWLKPKAELIEGELYK